MAIFRLASKSVFLTYPKCPLTKEELLLHLQTLTVDIKEYVIAEEEHKDGEPHLHAVLIFERKFDTMDQRYFDVTKEDKVYHPNIQSTKDRAAAIEYVKKAGNYMTNLKDKKSAKQKMEDAYAKAIEESTSAMEFLSTIEKVSPVSRVHSHFNMVGYANAKFPEPKSTFESSYDADTFDMLPEELEDWVRQYLSTFPIYILTTLTSLGQPTLPRPKSLIIISPSRFGKTQWARSLGRHMYFQGEFNLHLWDDNAEYAIFDDTLWKKIPFPKCFLGAQGEMSLSDKYLPKKAVVWGRPTIWLMNEFPKIDTDFSHNDRAWLQANSVQVILGKPLCSTIRLE